MKKFWRNFIVVILALLLLGAGGFLVWASNPAQPEAQALQVMQSTDGVQFEELNGWLVFSPDELEPVTGLILYPGGRVDYRAYASHASAIASDGFTVIIPPMPLNFAFLGINRAVAVMEAFPGITYWAVGGHSLGGAMAAEFASANPESVAGLALWASYPADSNDLSSTNLPVLSVYASNDGLATLDDIANSRNRLPADATFVEITGGNHAGFGWYGAQNGDGPATLSQMEQQELIVQATTAFLQTLGQ
jgi:pimeloyl-ACP methyl ester carboxylesterase